MSEPRDRRLPLALAMLHGVGRRRLRTLLPRTAGHTVSTLAEFSEFVTAATADLKMTVKPADVSQAWKDGVDLAAACERRGWRLWMIGEPDYATGLTRLHDPPALLFVQGHADPNAHPRVAIIGTREPSAWGERTARAVADAAVDAGAIVVSGLAWGVDTAAHEATVARHGRTWAMLPSGLDIIFPESNRTLAERIVRAGGALVSEYLPGSRPHHTFFIERDRLQAALSDAVIVIETSTTGGTMHTVKFAREVGVPVVATHPEGLELAPGAALATLPEPQQGTWTLLSEGAHRVSTDEVGAFVRELGHGNRAAPATSAKPPRSLLT